METPAVQPPYEEEEGDNDDHESVDLQHLRHQGFHQALLSLQPSNKTIDLSGKYITDEWFIIEFLPVFEILTESTQLFLSNNCLQDKALVGLARVLALNKHRKLVLLYLDSNEFTDEGLSSLLKAIPSSISIPAVIAYRIVPW